MNILNFLLRGSAGLALLSHGLIHSIVPPAWSGASPLLGGLVGGEALGTLVNALLGLTVICFAVAAAGVVRLPVARDVWMEAAAAGSLSSLAMFVVMWNALSPDSLGFVFGPIVSFIVVVPVSFRYWKARGAADAPQAQEIKEAG